MEASWELGPRFVRERLLGEGAKARVYSVVDVLHGARRALKLASGPESGEAFAREFRLLAELRHPGIVRAHDFGRTPSGLPYQSLELIHGVPLGPAAHQRDPEALGTIALQALEALAALHARGVLHRDLSPRNLLVVGRGAASVVRLIDFGMAQRIGRRARGAGTPPYVAPEVLRGEALDGRADLYSLGVILYEALLPEARVHTAEQLVSMLRERPAAPSRVDPRVPVDLSDFVMRLLAPARDDRFPDALAAAEALARIEVLRLGRGPRRANAERLMRAGAVSHRAALANRLLGLARAARSTGRGATVVLEGAVGVGKSPILRELAARACLEGLRVVQHRASGEPAAPLAKLLAAVTAVAPRLAREVAAASDAATAHDTRMLAPYVGRVARAVTRVLGSEATVLLLDDLHRADPVVIEILRAMVHEARELPLMLVCAGEPVPDAPSLGERLGDTALRLPIPPLTPREVKLLAAHRLVGLELPATAAARIASDCHGMPSLVERTLARLLVEGTIETDGWRFVFRGGRYAAARHRDPETLRERLGRVEDAAQLRVLWAAAVLGHDIEADAVAELCELPAEVVALRLAELVRLEILSPGDSSEVPMYGFARRQLQSGAYAAIPEAERRVLHDRAAARLQVRDPAGTRTEEHVEHLMRGSDEARAVPAAVAAGDRAAAVYADQRAIEYYARAYARLPRTTDTRGGPIALKLGRLFERNGELERAATWYQAALESAASVEPGLLAEASLGLAHVALERGATTDAERELERATTAARVTQDPRLLVEVKRIRALLLTRRGDVADARTLLEACLSELESVGAAAEMVDVLMDSAQAARLGGDIQVAVRHARRASKLAAARRDTATMAEASAIVARGYICAGELALAHRVLFESLRGVRANGDRLREALVLRELGHVGLREGDLAGALDRYEQALELARGVRSRASELVVLRDVGVVHAWLGAYRPAYTAFEASLELAREVGDARREGHALLARGQVAVRCGLALPARRDLDAALSIARAADDRVLDAMARSALAWAWAAAGESGELPPLDAAVLEDPFDHATARLQRARAAAAWREPEACMHELVEAERAVALGKVRLLEPSVSVVRAELCLARGERGRALDPLHAASEQAHAMGLPTVEAEAEGQLGALLEGTPEALAHLTRAMELMRGCARAAPPNVARSMLRLGKATRIQRAFRRAFEQATIGQRS